MPTIQLVYFSDAAIGRVQSWKQIQERPLLHERHGLNLSMTAQREWREGRAGRQQFVPRDRGNTQGRVVCNRQGICRMRIQRAQCLRHYPQEIHMLNDTKRPLSTVIWKNTHSSSSAEGLPNLHLSMNMLHDLGHAPQSLSGGTSHLNVHMNALVTIKHITL